MNTWQTGQPPSLFAVHYRIGDKVIASHGTWTVKGWWIVGCTDREPNVVEWAGPFRNWQELVDGTDPYLTKD